MLDWFRRWANRRWIEQTDCVVCCGTAVMRIHAWGTRDGVRYDVNVGSCIDHLAEARDLAQALIVEHTGVAHDDE